MAERAPCADDLAPDHLSVVVFGPGHGEGILVRFPDASLGVVDGCGEGTSNAVLQLARELRSRGGARVRFAALTHPHDDHLRGLDEVIRELEPEELWFAGAEHPRMFGELVARLQERERSSTGDHDAAARSAATSLHRIVDLLTSRLHEGRSTPHNLGDRQTHLDETVLGERLVVRSLLPTTRSKLQAWRRLGSDEVQLVDDTFPDDVEEKDQAINDLSCAILIEWGNARVLLGGDAEIGHLGRGWRAVSLQPPLHVLKVPHHASSGAFHAGLWESLRPELSIVTPFKHGAGRMPPQRPGLDAFALHSGQLLLTSPPTWLAPSRGPRGLPNANASKVDPGSAVVVNLTPTGELRYSLHGHARPYP